MTVRHWAKPSGFAWVLTTVGVAVFVTLGVWQLHRAVEKQRLLAAFAAPAQESTMDLARVADSVDAEHYPHVRVSGHYVANRGYWLDEQMNAGIPGIHAIAVFAS